MSYRLVATASAIVSLAYGVPMLAFPDVIFSLYGVPLDVNTALATRMLAGSYLGYAILNFLTRDTADATTRRGVAAGNAFGWAASLAISAYGQVQGLANGFGWTSVALQIVFIAAWLSTYTPQRDARREPQRAAAR